MTITDRNALIEKYLYLVQQAAAVMKRRVPRSVEYSDLYQVGAIGLQKAAESWDPNRHVLFSTYAPRRIWGEMQDFLRGCDHLSRTHRRDVGKEGGPHLTSIHRPIRTDKDDDLGFYFGEEQESPVDSTDECRKLLRGLTRRERLVMLLYHVEGLAMSQVGRAIGVSESMISQIHTNVLARLRAGKGAESIRHERSRPHRHPKTQR